MLLLRCCRAFVRQSWHRLRCRDGRSRARPRFRPLVEVMESRLAPAAHTWTGAGSLPVWSDPTNWIGGAPTPGETNVLLTFPGAAPNRVNTNDVANLDVRSIVFADQDYVIAGQPVTASAGLGVEIAAGVFGPDTVNLPITLQNGTQMNVNAVESGATLTFGAPIGGTGSLDVILGNNGNIVLSANNTYNGFTRIEAGTLRNGVTDALPVTTGLFSFAGGTYDLSGFGQQADVQNYDGILTNTSPTAVTFTANEQSGIGFVSGLVLGNLGLNVTGAAALFLTNSFNGYTGGTAINGGHLTIDSDGELGAAGTPIAFAGGTLEFTGGFGTPRPITLGAGTNTFQVDAGQVVQLDGLIDGTGGLTVATFISPEGGSTVPGKLVLTADNTYAGPTAVDSGTLEVNGRQPQSNVTVATGAELEGNGVVGAVTAAGQVSPGSGGPGTLTTGNLQLNGGDLEADVNGTTAGSQYDVLNVNGTVDLTNGTLTLLYTANTPVGTTFTLLSNDGTDVITGTFNGFPEGAQFTLNNGTVSQRFQITYVGGDGNDVVLTRINTPPTVNAPGPQSVTEGVAGSFALGSFDDPDPGGPWQVSVNWGDGSPPTTFAAAAPGSLGSQQHTYADNVGSPFTVTVTVTDPNGQSGSNSFAVTVFNARPVVTAAADQTANEGTPTAFNLGSFADPGADSPWTVTVDWGDGTAPTTFTVNAAGALPAQTHTYADNAALPFPVTVTVRDKDGAQGSAGFRVTVANVTPVVTAPANQTANEGGAPLISLGSFADPGADNPWTVTVNWGDGTPNTTFTATAPGALAAQPHTFADNVGSPFPVTVTVRDKDNAPSAPVTFQVTVNNVAPAVTAPGPQTSTEGTATVFALGSFTDPGADSPWAVSVNWGDGTPATTFAVTAPGAIPPTAHAYATGNGSPFTVTVTVTDKDGAPGSASFQVTVANVAPAVTAPAAQAAAEGTAQSFNLGSFADAAADGPWQVAVNWGDGTPATTFSVTAPGALPASAHTYADNAGSPFPVTVSVTDRIGVVGSASFGAEVANVAPANLVLGPVPGSIREGDTVTLTGSFTDPGTADTHTVTVTWGDGTPATVLNLPAGVLSFGVNHLYADDNPSGTPSDVNTIVVQVVDKDGAAAPPASVSLVVNNVPPTLSGLTFTPPAQPGGVATLSGVIVDPGQDSFALLVSWGDGTFETFYFPVGTTNIAVQHTYAVGIGQVSVGVSLSDDDTGPPQAEGLASISGSLPLPPTPPSAPGPFDKFVTALYHDVLHRDPDAGGFTFWTGVLAPGRLNRPQVSLLFLRSEERQGVVVDSFYQQVLGRNADATGRAVWVAALVSGRMNDADVVVAFVTSAEFTNRFPANRDFVAEIYRVLLDRPNGATDFEINLQTRALDSRQLTRADMARGFLASDEAFTKAIQDFYRVYLRREASFQEVVNRLVALRTGTVDSATEQASFLGSEEYYQLVNR
jgi:autotransporter-associated beta strand protein